MLQQTIQITAAQILAMNVTPIPLVGPPGAGKLLVPIAIAYKLHFGGVAYNFGGIQPSGIGWTKAGSTLYAMSLPNANLNSAQDFIATQSATSSNHAAAPDLQTNLGLVLDRLGGAAVAGNGTMTLTIYYAVASTL